MNLGLLLGCIYATSVFAIYNTFLKVHLGLDGPQFRWQDLTPSTRLDYHSCYNDFECAKLVLPLDWQDGLNPNNISIAVIRLPAVIPEDDPRHGGSVIINPGGPGGSGVLYARGAAQKIQNLLAGDKHYEIVSFDPRGVFYSTPSVFCFSTAFESELWWQRKRAVGNLDRSEAALKYQWALEEARGRACEESSNGQFDNGDDLRQHISTAYVARDIFELVQKIEERKSIPDIIDALPVEQATMNSPRHEKPEARLQYIGGSYGTFLGQTYASFFPENVALMILDSNLDADNWVSKYEGSVDDHESIREYFFQTCFDAGHRCKLWRSIDEGPDDIQNRYFEVVAGLEQQPVAGMKEGHIWALTADELQWGFFTTLYQPDLFFERFAEYLHDLFTGTEPAEPFWQHLKPSCNSSAEEILSHVLHNGEASTAIHCSDGPNVSNSSLVEYERYLQDLTTRFPNAGAIQAEYKLSCYTWPQSLRTKHRYSGPFTGSVPILFLNNRLDPVAPLKNARKMSDQFEGSGVLVQESVGHGVLFPAGDCIWRHVRAYFDDGVLPVDDTVCGSQCTPFGETCKDDLAAEALPIPLRLIS